MRKLIKKGVPKVIQNDLKRRPRATSGSIFEIFGGFRKYSFLNDFLIGKKLTKNLQKCDFGRGSSCFGPSLAVVCRVLRYRLVERFRAPAVGG
jgi:hypothetical protein